MKLVIDIETSTIDFNSKILPHLQSGVRIFCLVAKDIETDQVYPIIDYTEMLDLLNKATLLIGHNIIGFDLPILRTVLNFKKDVPIYDTLVISRMVSANMSGHSLRECGRRLGVFKMDYNGGFETFSKEMLDYCIQDVHTCHAVYKSFTDTGFSQESIELENRVALLTQDITEKGVYFNVDLANDMFIDMQKEHITIAESLKSLFSPWYTNLGEFIPKTNRNGYTIGAPCTKIEYTVFNPGSTQHIASRLIAKYNWKPKVTTATGQAAITEDVLETLSFPEVKQLLRSNKLKKLLGMLATGSEAWINNEYNHRIHGRINSGGTVSGRCSHNKPNLGQVPAKSELRKLFTATPGNVLVGCDASGLELRCLAHYMAIYDHGEYAHEVVQGDVHTKNQQAAGLKTRDLAKSFIYACVPMDTQVLTDTGWKTYDELTVGELVLTYNSEKEIKEFKPILEKVYYKEAEVIEMSHSHGFTVRTTPNHRWFVRQRHSKLSKKGQKYYLTPEGRYMTPEVRTTDEINTESNIITNAPFVDNRTELPKWTFQKGKYDIDWVKQVMIMTQAERQAFLQGFLLADGYKMGSTDAWHWNQNKTNIAEGLLVASYLEHSGNLYIREYQGTNQKMYNVNLSCRSHITGQRLTKRALANQPVWCIRTENESFVIRQGNTITITGNTLYGAGSEKIASILDCSEKDAKQTIKRFNHGLPALKALKDQIQKAYARGWLKGLDGRRLYVRSAHSALNLLLQSAGAILMKKALDIYVNKCYVANMKPNIILWVHDEFEVDVPPNQGVTYGEMLKTSIIEAGVHFGFRCPLDAEYRIGTTWFDVH